MTHSNSLTMEMNERVTALSLSSKLMLQKALREHSMDWCMRKMRETMALAVEKGRFPLPSSNQAWQWKI